MAVTVGKKRQQTPVVESPPTDSFEELEYDLGETEPIASQEVKDGFKTVDASNTRKPLPQFPAKVVKNEHTDSFFEWIASLTDEDFMHVSIYMYRTWPFIDRQQVDPKAYSYIDNLGRKFTREDLLLEHGSGEYKFTVNDLNKTVAGKGGQIGTVYLTLDDKLHPPKLILEELQIDHPKNKRYVDRLKAEGKLTNDGRIMTQQSQGGTENAAAMKLVGDLVKQITSQPQQRQDSTVETVTSMLAKTHDQSMAMLREQSKGDDPNKMLGLVTTMMTLLQANKPADNSSELLATVLKIQGDAQARTDGMMTKMMEMMTASKGGGIKEEVETLLAIKDAFGGEGGPSVKRSTAEVVIDAVAPLVGKVFDTVNALMSMKNYQAGLAQKPVVEVTNPELPPIAPERTTEGENVVEMPQSQTSQMVAMIKGPAGPMIISALQRGQTGSAFAEGVENMLGPLVYKQIIAVGKPAMLDAMKAVPEFVKSLQTIGATDQVITEFIDDFFAYDEAGEEGEES